MKRTAGAHPSLEAIIDDQGEHIECRYGISVNRYIGLADISANFQISDIGIGWNSTDILDIN